MKYTCIEVYPTVFAVSNKHWATPFPNIDFSARLEGCSNLELVARPFETNPNPLRKRINNYSSAYTVRNTSIN